MSKKEWMIYGAYGYTGKLITKEAVAKGHSPILAGRSADELREVAQKLDLEYRVFNLSDVEDICRNIEGLNSIIHAAGPFIHTSKPMVEACLEVGVHYLDITGEIPVFEQNFTYDEEAKEKDIAIISGVGFDVVPTDCLANYVSHKIADPNLLELAIAGLGEISPGTLKTMVEHAEKGILIRENGELTELRGQYGKKEIRFSDKPRTVAPTVWGDLASAYYSTKIPNIVVYMPFSKALARVLRETKFDKQKAYEWIEQNVNGPDEHTRKISNSYIWARVSNEKGDEAQVWLETMEGYRFTAISSVKSIEKVLQIHTKGALTPSLAFSEDFILEFPETKRMDQLNK
ncbi:MAG: Trans-acting enoyl reductase [Promethearchaeota archaeon]|nr:MAG: Trans-acting enoyl reductase [Candidatus Lokiarchaeota archaeon]